MLLASLIASWCPFSVPTSSTGVGEPSAAARPERNSSPTTIGVWLGVRDESPSPVTSIVAVAVWFVPVESATVDPTRSPMRRRIDPATVATDKRTRAVSVATPSSGYQRIGMLRHRSELVENVESSFEVVPT